MVLVVVVVVVLAFLFAFAFVLFAFDSLEQPAMNAASNTALKRAMILVRTFFPSRRNYSLILTKLLATNVPA